MAGERKAVTKGLDNGLSEGETGNRGPREFLGVGGEGGVVKNGLRGGRKLGHSQNFLKDSVFVGSLIDEVGIGSGDVVVEIGPGKGALTAKLLESAGLVVAVEKDKELFHLLEEKFAKEIKNKSFILVEDDILDFDIQKIIPTIFQLHDILFNENACLA